MTKTEMQQVAEQHGFRTEYRGGLLYVMVPWSQRMHDGQFMTGEDAELVGSASDLRRTLGY